LRSLPIQIKQSVQKREKRETSTSRYAPESGPRKASRSPKVSLHSNTVFRNSKHILTIVNDYSHLHIAASRLAQGFGGNLLADDYFFKLTKNRLGKPYYSATVAFETDDYMEAKIGRKKQSGAVPKARLAFGTAGYSAAVSNVLKRALETA